MAKHYTVSKKTGPFLGHNLLSDFDNFFTVADRN